MIIQGCWAFLLPSQLSPPHLRVSEVRTDCLLGTTQQFMWMWAHVTAAALLLRCILVRTSAIPNKNAATWKDKHANLASRASWARLAKAAHVWVSREDVSQPLKPYGIQKEAYCGRVLLNSYWWSKMNCHNTRSWLDAKNVTTIRAIPAVQHQRRNMESKQESIVTFNCVLYSWRWHEQSLWRLQTLVYSCNLSLEFRSIFNRLPSIVA